ncbi:hypothetical protein CK516_25870 [Nostoc sp. 'Peltigera malacea cyanobiont' DB3992]|nr:hypothetical protein CK516_25870 [Nostoc sp. 'Peltigera malacea cyanobiont' DB3992]
MRFYTNASWHILRYLIHLDDYTMCNQPDLILREIPIPKKDGTTRMLKIPTVYSYCTLIQ